MIYHMTGYNHFGFAWSKSREPDPNAKVFLVVLLVQVVAAAGECLRLPSGFAALTLHLQSHSLTHIYSHMTQS